MDRRPSSPAEPAWRAYRSLSRPTQRDLVIKLGELIGADSSDKPSRLELVVAAVAVGYTTGLAAGVGTELEQTAGVVTTTAIGWLWEKWRR